ncbi:hypothetical protein ACWFMI_10770 [Nocardiopsis terrae]
MAFFAVVVAFALFVFSCMLATFTELPWPGVLIASVGFGSVFWIQLKIGLLRNVEIREHEIVLNNYFTRVSVPISSIREVRVSDGSLALELHCGRILDSAAFEGSLLAMILGSPSAKRAAVLIDRARREEATGGKFVSEEPVVRLRMNLMFLLGIWAFVFVLFWYLNSLQLWLP